MKDKEQERIEALLEKADDDDAAYFKLMTVTRKASKKNSFTEVFIWKKGAEDYPPSIDDISVMCVEQPAVKRWVIRLRTSKGKGQIGQVMFDSPSESPELDDESFTASKTVAILSSEVIKVVQAHSEQTQAIVSTFTDNLQKLLDVNFKLTQEYTAYVRAQMDGIDRRHELDLNYRAKVHKQDKDSELAIFALTRDLEEQAQHGGFWSQMAESLLSNPETVSELVEAGCRSTIDVLRLLKEATKLITGKGNGAEAAAVPAVVPAAEGAK